VKPLVSIVVNNYNYSQFLHQPIDSALSQTYADTEVIVVDDGSSDRSPEIITTYGSRIIPVLKNNGGQASALNAGFQASSGDIVIFLDADDYLFPHAAEKVVAAWQEGLAKVHYRLELVDVNGNFINIFPPPEVPLDQGEQVLTNLLAPGRYSTCVTSGNAFSRTALIAIFPMPEEDYRIAADGYLVTLVLFYGRVTNIETPLGAYRQHNSNFWSTREELSASKFRKYVTHDIK
jgi:glycosyltransferase involved in cell wall biosynthesis